MDVNSTNKKAVKRLEDELLLLLAKQGKRVPVPVFLCAALLASFVYESLPTIVWVSWLIWVGVILSLRWYILGRLPYITNVRIKTRINIAVILSAINGITMGVSLGFFPYITETERAIQSLILVGLCAGAVATTAGYRKIFLAYISPVLFPLVIFWIINPGVEPNLTQYIVALLITMFCFVLIGLAQDSYRLMTESFNIRLEQTKLNKKLQKALEEAELANRAKTQFLASASHDLRQPIHTLSLYGAALNLRPLDERSKSITKEMDVALQSLANQLDALLDISKLDAGVVKVNRTTLNLHSFLERMYTEFLPTANNKRLKLYCECPNEIHIDTDEFLFERIVRNLLSNSIKYTNEGAVKISVVNTYNGLELLISDTGIGISKLEQNKVFEEFYQIHNSQRDHSKGLGLGLAIVKRLAHLLNIKIDFTSSTDSGTEFRLSLVPAIPLENKTVKEIYHTNYWGKLHILVVDDQVAAREGMKALLEEIGCSVSVAESTKNAIHEAKLKKPDILLADFRLIGNDNGINTIQMVRNIFPQMPAILISGDTDPARLKQANDKGIEILHKPVAVELLKQSILDTLQKNHQSMDYEYEE